MYIHTPSLFPHGGNDAWISSPYLSVDPRGNFLVACTTRVTTKNLHVRQRNFRHAAAVQDFRYLESYIGIGIHNISHVYIYIRDFFILYSLQHQSTVSYYCIL